MFLLILSKEIRQHLLTFRFAAALLTTFVLVVVSVWILGDDYIRRRNAYNLATELSARKNLEVYVPSQLNPTLHRPPSPLSIFAQGEDKRFGNSIKVHRWSIPREATDSFNDNTLLAARPAFDLLSVFALVISLFGLLFSYDRICGERERGTLKLLVAGLPRRGSLYLAKFCAAVLCLAIPLLVSFISSLLIIVFVFDLSFASSQWLAITAMFFAGLVYGALFIALGLVCSAFVRGSGTALVLSVFLWTVGVLFVPSASQGIAAASISLLSPSEISSLESASESEIYALMRRDFYPKFPESGSGWGAGGWSSGGYYLFDGSELNFAHTAERVRFLEPLMLERAREIWHVALRYKDQKKIQAVLADMLSAVAPVHHLRTAFTALAGTNVTAYDEFLETARRYYQEMVADFRRRDYFGRNALEFFTRRPISEIDDIQYSQRVKRYRNALESGADWQDVVFPVLWGPLPENAIPPFPSIESHPDTASAIRPVAVIFIAAVILFAIGLAAFVRYDVR